MNKTSVLSVFTLLLVLGLLSHCSSSNEKEIPLSQEGFHFIGPESEEIKPLNLQFDGNTYIFVYSNGESWNFIRSEDLLDWSEVGEIPMNGRYQGSLVIDHANSSSLGAGDRKPWIIISEDDGGLNSIYSLDEKNWYEMELDISDSIRGVPSISNNLIQNEWIMTVTKGRTTTLLKSANLKEWEWVTSLALPATADKTHLNRVNGVFALITDGAEPKYQIMDTSFQPRTDFLPLRIYNSSFTSSIDRIEERVIMFHTIGNRILSAPKQLNSMNDLVLTAVPSDELQEIAATKRRGKLSKLKGQKASRFTFRVDDYQQEFSIAVFNEQGEETVFSFEKQSNTVIIDQRSGSNAFEGELNELSWLVGNPPTTIDIIIDHNSIELIINNGVVVIPIEVNPVFIYDQIRLMTDGEIVDASAILYTLDASLI